MTEPIAWLNGEFVPLDQARLHVFDLGIVGGVSVAEMLRTFRHRLFRVDEHLDRLQQSLQLAGLHPSVTSLDFSSRLEHVVRHNAGLLDHEDDLGAILFITAGLNPTYAGREVATSTGCSVGVHTFPLPYRTWAAKYDEGISLVVPSVRAIPGDVVDPQIKSRSRMHWHLAEQEARQIEPGAMAILTDHAGHLTETAASNLIAVLDGQLVSPPAGTVLEGISLGVVAELAEKIGRPLRRRPLSPHELSSATEAFLSSTPPCLLPVTRFQGQPIGTDRPGPVYRQLLSAWNELVGLDIREQMQRHSL